jgi:hypothetical protein
MGLNFVESGNKLTNLEEVFEENNNVEKIVSKHCVCIGGIKRYQGEFFVFNNVSLTSVTNTALLSGTVKN